MSGSVEVPQGSPGPALPPYGSAPVGRRPSRRRALLARLLLLVVVVLGVTAYRIHQATTSTGSVGVGDCVKRSGSDKIEQASCSSSAAFGKVIAKHKGADLFGANCPDDADTAGTYELNATVCIRNLAGPHPSDPGNGGGDLRSGDCVNGIADAGEVACSSPKAVGKVAALVADPGSCPAAATDSASRSSDPKVVCVAPGPVPLCYDDPTVTFGGNQVGCDASTARFKVTGRAAAAEQCPAGSATYDDKDALPAARFQCLAEVPGG